MCISFKKSEMSNTILYAGQGIRNGKKVHVLAYQNKATSYDSKPNAMIIPFPTESNMSQENIIDTSKFRNFLQDITNASKSVRRSLTLNDELRSVSVFESGSYTVILANHCSQIKEALSRVPEDKRPEISDDFLSKFNEIYPNQPVAVCCWKGSINPEPLLWWYEPKDPDVLFIPTMDAHDGEPPKLDAVVITDHIISVGSHQRFGSKVNYQNEIPKDVISLLPDYVVGSRLPTTISNGDIFVATNQDDSQVVWYRGTTSNIVKKGEMLGWE